MRLVVKHHRLSLTLGLTVWLLSPTVAAFPYNGQFDGSFSQGRPRTNTSLNQTPTPTPTPAGVKLTQKQLEELERINQGITGSQGPPTAPGQTATNPPIRDDASPTPTSTPIRDDASPTPTSTPLEEGATQSSSDRWFWPVVVFLVSVALILVIVIYKKLNRNKKESGSPDYRGRIDF
jgi:hypothetical protein